MDLYSPDPDMHRRVGREIARSGEKFVLQAHLCTEWTRGQYRATRDLATVREHYASLNVKAGDCVECGSCVKRCPFGVDVIANMREAKRIFGA